MRVADYIINYIYKAGTSHVFILSGGGAMYLNDALHKNKINYVCCHHEGACVYAAEAYAKFTGNVGCAMVTSGPASTNAITGLLEAYQNSIPVIILSSQAKRSQMSRSVYRQVGVQEMDIISVVKPLTKFATVLEAPEYTKSVMKISYIQMLEGRKGPVWLDIPPDVAAQEYVERNQKPL